MMQYMCVYSNKNTFMNDHAVSLFLHVLIHQLNEHTVFVINNN